MNSETIEIDSDGRLALPTSLLERFNLHPGDKLRITFDQKAIQLEPSVPAGTLVQDGPGLVFKGNYTEPLTVELTDRLIQEDRDRVLNETLRMLPEK